MKEALIMTRAIYLSYSEIVDPCDPAIIAFSDLENPLERLYPKSGSFSFEKMEYYP